MLLRLIAIGLCLLTLGAVTATVKMRHDRPYPYASGLFEEPISTSEPIRVEQANEFDRYLTAVRTDSGTRKSVFKPDFVSPAAYATSTEPLRHLLAESIGYPPPGKPDQEEPAFTRIGGDRQAEYYRARIPVLPGVHASGLYIVPVTAGKHPLVVAIHGAKGSPEVATFAGGANYRDLTRGAVAQGYAVWAPQHLFVAEGFRPDLRQEMDARARLVGTSVFAIEIAKMRRALDVILKRPEIDPERVATVGHSYGGLYALIGAALDPRIKAVVTSCFFGAQEDRFDGTPDSKASDLLFKHGQTLLRAPELTALVCPRPVLVQMGSKDPLVNVDTARRLIPEARDYFQKLGKGDMFQYMEVDDAHEFHGEQAWPFLKAHL